ncbi:Hypothetical protein PP7435_CHR1-1719 [Komagataella phaffii CBS 7435]|uniref:Uncharacterized protein n=1 Tax=Komagataella phaffii (strain ATCC 76273 / CBS 7435 / CECT 11047 / NRRL Y-11430 / Wegner 21-1) TaxID=981350 RepID=A0A1G4KP29_KOMPC|nr:Hypothetical protein BQ9382_C1-0817 [Komagataella phaffii CBS 7435]SCV11765.1 Hypothetical protein PP7435_CHR1-1719 [Komagataella phaffii CBS 7435]
MSCISLLVNVSGLKHYHTSPSPDVNSWFLFYYPSAYFAVSNLGSMECFLPFFL